jgi:hypothetical protein
VLPPAAMRQCSSVCSSLVLSQTNKFNDKYVGGLAIFGQVATAATASKSAGGCYHAFVIEDDRIGFGSYPSDTAVIWNS